MSIYAKLANIQKDLFVPKDNRNDFGKYNYRSCEDILKTVKPLCESNGCVLYITNDLVSIGDRNYVEAIVRLIDTESGECVESKAHAREEETKKGMDGSQITGSSSSYARKYALAGLFSIDNEKDSDATNTHGKDEQGQALDEATLRMEVLKITSNMSKENVEKICKYYGCEKPTQMNASQCRDYLNKYKAKQEEK